MKNYFMKIMHIFIKRFIKRMDVLIWMINYLMFQILLKIEINAYVPDVLHTVHAWKVKKKFCIVVLERPVVNLKNGVVIARAAQYS